MHFVYLSSWTLWTRTCKNGWALDSASVHCRSTCRCFKLHGKPWPNCNCIYTYIIYIYIMGRYVFWCFFWHPDRTCQDCHSWKQEKFIAPCHHVTWNWVMLVTPAIGCLDLRCFPGVTVRSGWRCHPSYMPGSLCHLNRLKVIDSSIREHCMKLPSALMVKSVKSVKLETRLLCQVLASDGRHLD